MRLAIIGQRPFGKSVLEAFLGRGDQVAGVFCAPERPGGRPDPLRLEAEQRGLPVFQLTNLQDSSAEGLLSGLEVDLAVMAYVTQYVSQDFAHVPRHGTIQYHPSLLPRYRGPSSINWPIINGETETGVTVFRPAAGLDEGEVILQRPVAIDEDETAGSLYFDKLYPLGVTALVEAADLVVHKGARGRPQEDGGSYEGWCRDEAAHVNWHHHLDVVYNLVRGCDPSPGAWTTLDGAPIGLLSASKQVARRFADVAGPPGQVVAIADETVVVAGQGGALTVGRIARGGVKLPAATVAREIGLSVGAQLGT